MALSLRIWFPHVVLTPRCHLAALNNTNILFYSKVSQRIIGLNSKEMAPKVHWWRHYLPDQGRCLGRHHLPDPEGLDLVAPLLPEPHRSRLEAGPRQADQGQPLQQQPHSSQRPSCRRQRRRRRCVQHAAHLHRLLQKSAVHPGITFFRGLYYLLLLLWYLGDTHFLLI